MCIKVHHLKSPFPMQKPSFFLLPALALGVALVSLPCSTVRSAIVTWGGSDGEYTTGANWVGGSVPNTGAGDTALITAGNVTYTPGGDLFLQNGGVLQIDGGSWTQAGGIAWIQAAGGTIFVNGGVFNQGTSANIVKNASTVITVASGTANFNGNLIYDSASTGQLNITGGTVNVANEFKPIETFTMTTGVLNAQLISFADGPGSLNFAGGDISVNGAGGFSGFYGGGTKSLNFTTGSSGTLFFSTYTLADLTADAFLTNGTIRYDGAIDASAFQAIEGDGGVYVSLVVPEPSAVVLACAGLGAALFLRRRSAV